MRYSPFPLKCKLFLHLSSCFLYLLCTVTVVVVGGEERITKKNIGERRLFPTLNAFHFFRLVQFWVRYCTFCGILTPKMGKRKEGKKQARRKRGSQYSLSDWCAKHGLGLLWDFSLTTAGRDLFLIPFTDRVVKLQVQAAPPPSTWSNLLQRSSGLTTLAVHLIWIQ